AISYTFGTRFDTLARTVIERVEATWPSDNPEETVEVDVVGVSMGGLVARWAALPPADRFREGAAHNPGATGKRLRIRNLYTLGTPHRGAILANLIAPDPIARDMRAGSGFLRTLDARLP